MKGNLYIEILSWAYENRFKCFTEEQLFKKFNLGEQEDLKKWYLRVFRGGNTNNECLIGIFGGGNESQYLCLTAKGLSAAVDYLILDEAQKASGEAENHALWAIKVALAALVVGIVTACLQINSNTLTQRALELSAEPMLSIAIDRNSIPEELDKVTIAAGLLPSENSLLKLLLINNSVAAIEQADMRMTLWKLYVNEENRHLTVCPFGYVEHSNNPNFVISNLSTTNLFNKNFNLREGERYPFSIDFSSLRNTQLIPNNSRILLKVDVNFVKTVNHSNYNYVKLYMLNAFEEYVVDIEIAPTLALGLNDKKEEKEAEGFKIPSFIHPFQEEEFLNYFEKPSPELDLTTGACKEFTLSKELKTIFY